jgi:ribosomal protein S18 acetylase RimI-like enzyme
MCDFKIKETTDDRGLICDELLHSLPQWFGIESAIQQYVLDVERMPTFVAYLADRLIGFVSLNLRNQWTAEIHVMAIHPEFHRRGIGRNLLAISEDYLRSRGYEFLSVKTISPLSQSKEYETTRRFYFSVGFRPVEEFKTLWGEANPCLLMIKAL